MTQPGNVDGSPARATSDDFIASELAEGELWIGRHSADDDILVFDPAESDPSAPVLELYSLTQHRTRRFPRSIVIQRIETLDDRKAAAKAKRAYDERAELREAHEQELETARTERFEQIRTEITEAHERYLEGLGIEYQGVTEPDPDRRSRLTRCHACGIELDGFVGVVCAVCSTPLCSCGACACGRASRKTKT